MPFGKTKSHPEKYWTDFYETKLRPLISKSGFTPHRSQPLRGDLVREIIRQVIVSQAVVADLTDSNPNVFWELGVRQSFKHGTITIAEQGTNLPFDLSTKGTLFYYPENKAKHAQFEKQFSAALDDCLVNPEKPDSVVLETISGRGSLFDVVHRSESIRRLDGLIDEMTWNDNVYTRAVRTANGNMKRPAGERSAITDRLRTASTELLIGHRYVDEDHVFFKCAGQYHIFLLAINDQLSQWAAMPTTVEPWLLADPRRKQCFDDFMERVRTARKKLSEQQ